MAVTEAKGRLAARNVDAAAPPDDPGLHRIGRLQHHRRCRAAPQRLSVRGSPTAHSNVEKLIEQALRLKPKLAVIGDPALYDRLKSALAGSGIEATAGARSGNRRNLPAGGMGHVLDSRRGRVGAHLGRHPARGHHRSGQQRNPCLCRQFRHAGGGEARRSHAAGRFEHSAIFQVFDFDKVEAIEKLSRTASGGPFHQIHGRDGSRHPGPGRCPSELVDGGAKISVDSATMMNKGLGDRGHHHLAWLRSKIDILVHPNPSSTAWWPIPMVRFWLSSAARICGPRSPMPWLASASTRLQPGLVSPRSPSLPLKHLIHKRFPALHRTAGATATGGRAPTILNAANEVAVAAFLDGGIRFTDIARSPRS